MTYTLEQAILLQDINSIRHEERIDNLCRLVDRNNMDERDFRYTALKFRTNYRASIARTFNKLEWHDQILFAKHYIIDDFIHSKLNEEQKNILKLM